MKDSDRLEQNNRLIEKLKKGGKGKGEN